MVEQAPPWPKQGPASYFPSIEKYGRSIAEWQQIMAGGGLEKHMVIVGYLRSEHGMGHGHANALVGWACTLRSPAQLQPDGPVAALRTAGHLMPSAQPKLAVTASAVCERAAPPRAGSRHDEHEPAATRGNARSCVLIMNVLFMLLYAPASHQAG